MESNILGTIPDNIEERARFAYWGVFLLPMAMTVNPLPLFMLKSLYGAAIRYTTRRERVYCHGQSLTYNLETIIMGY